jgi:transcription initiation factor TFIIIB Brf1 subunit/transcription initiation factor TFIIB
MSKEVTAQLLKINLSKLNTETERKQRLIDCLKSQGFVKEEIEPMVEQPGTYDVCKICNSSNFIFTSNDRICEQCGLAEHSLDANPYKTYKADINLKKGTFIEPGSLIINVVKDGKTVKRDLSKVNTWLSSDPEEQRIKLSLAKITEVLELVSSDYNPITFERVKNEVLSMWYNIISIRSNIRGNERLSLMAWCIYYPLVFNGLNINIQKISTILGVPIGDVFSYNFVMKDIFSDTPFQKYITVPTGIIQSLNLPPEYERKFKIVKRDLKDYLSSPIKDKEYYAMIYFISSNADRKYTLSYLANLSGISGTTLGTESNKILKFYNKNPKLKKNLI